MAMAEVKVVQEASRSPPVIQLGPVNQTLPVKAAATLPCEASDHEIVIWLKDGVPLSSLATETRIIVDKDNTLTINGTKFQKINSKNCPGNPFLRFRSGCFR